VCFNIPEKSKEMIDQQESQADTEDHKKQEAKPRRSEIILHHPRQQKEIGHDMYQQDNYSECGFRHLLFW